MIQWFSSAVASAQSSDRVWTSSCGRPAVKVLV